MNGKNEVFEYLIDQLRNQVDNNPYKQQCEDLAHEVGSLKNQLRDASALVAELQETIKLMNEDFNRTTNRGDPTPKGVRYVVGEHGPEQSGCRKGDTQECKHEFVYSKHKSGLVCFKCGARKEYTSDEESWIEWEGGECPVPRGELVDVIYRDGKTLYCFPADEIHCTSRDASCIFWQHDGGPSDIVRYRKAAHQ